MLVGAMQSVFIIEQPSSSLLFEYCYVKAALRLLRIVGNKVGAKSRASLPVRYTLPSSECRTSAWDVRSKPAWLRTHH